MCHVLSPKIVYDVSLDHFKHWVTLLPTKTILPTLKVHRNQEVGKKKNQFQKYKQFTCL